MRIIRVLIYDGNEAWIRQTMQWREVKGKIETPGGTIAEYYLIESSLLGVLQNHLILGENHDPTDPSV